MKRCCVYGLLAAFFLPTAVLSDPIIPRDQPQVLSRLNITSTEKSYGLFIVAATDTLCPFLRYRVAVAGHGFVTPALLPGHGTVLQLPPGIPVGNYPVRVRVVGCDAPVPEISAVVLRKTSPDHGARALAALSAENKRKPPHRQCGTAPA